MSDPFTDAWAEAMATAPPQLEVYATIEVIHPAFVENDVPFSIRAVTGATSDMNFTLEEGAELNGGETVEFKAIPFSFGMPVFEEGKIPEAEIIIDNVAREMIPYLETAVRMRADMTATYREYRSDDLTAPCYGPVTFLIKRVKALGTRITGTAKIEDLANRKFPNKVYSINEFPGLQT